MSFKVDSEGVAVKVGLRPEVAEKWVKALRSGEYKQTQGSLQHTKEVHEGPEGFCCLGVLCDVAVKEGLDIPVTPLDNGQVRYGNAGDARVGSLPNAVMEWAGLTATDPYLTVPNPKHDPNYEYSSEMMDQSLSTLNDTFNYTLEKIADIIEEAVRDGDL